ncbi:MAG TPA: hypothetical protein VN773_09555 [Verrucomicrobiae bacterium]|nr:hypothetical protein [Verrucomicrobiae bacterium]
MRIRSVLSHSAQVIAEGALLSLLVVGLMAGTAFAAKGGGGGHTKPGGGSGGTGTITLAPIVTDNNGNGLPNWSDFVAFNVSTTATTEPWVNLVCSQNGVVVANGWDGYFAASITGTKFGLYSSAWTGGAADCVAYLTTPTWTRLGSTSFHVDG